MILEESSPKKKRRVISKSEASETILSDLENNDFSSIIDTILGRVQVIEDDEIIK